MIQYNANNEQISKNKWDFEYFENHTFLVLTNNLYSIPIKLDSTNNGKAYLSTYDKNIQQYVFEEQPKIKLENLVGKWHISNEKEVKKPMPIIDPHWRNYIENLTFSKDSITIASIGQNSTSKWELSGSGGIIYVLGKNFRSFRITSLTQQEMELEIGGEYFEGEKRLLYKKNTGNNTSYETP